MMCETIDLRVVKGTGISERGFGGDWIVILKNGPYPAGIWSVKIMTSKQVDLMKPYQPFS